MTSVDNMGRPVPCRHLSSFSSTGIALEASDYPAHTRWTFDTERFALRMAQSPSTELQTPRADPTPMNPNFDDHKPNNFNTETCPRNGQGAFHETVNIPMAELTSPMAASPLDLDMHASSSSSNPGLDPAPETQAQHQSPDNQYNVMGTTPTHTCPDPMNLNGGLPPNQFDFIFFDRMLLGPESHTASTNAVPQFLDSLETTIRNMEVASLPLQTYLIQQQLVAGIPANSVQTMFAEMYESGINTNLHEYSELIVVAGESDINISCPDRPRYEGIPPAIRESALAKILGVPRTTAVQTEHTRLVRFYYESFRNMSGIAREGEGERDGGMGAGLENVIGSVETGDLNIIESVYSSEGHSDTINLNGIPNVNGGGNNDIEMGEVDIADDLRSLFGDDGMDCE